MSGIQTPNPVVQTESNHYLVVILFAVIVLGGALGSLLVGAIYGKLDPVLALALGTWLVIAIAGQCIMKERPASEGRSWMWRHLRSAALSRASLR